VSGLIGKLAFAGARRKSRRCDRPNRLGISIYVFDCNDYLGIFQSQGKFDLWERRQLRLDLFRAIKTLRYRKNDRHRIVCWLAGCVLSSASADISLLGENSPYLSRAERAKERESRNIHTRVFRCCEQKNKENSNHHVSWAVIFFCFIQMKTRGNESEKFFHDKWKQIPFLYLRFGVWS